MKTDWELADYPVRFRHFDPKTVEDDHSHGVIPCIAQIINWWQMTGCGDTREDALKDLEKNLSEYRKTVGPPPRPGKRFR